MGTAVGLITTGAGILSQQQGAQQAAGQIAGAADANIRFLEEAGVKGARDISRAAGEGTQVLLDAQGNMIAPIQRFADVGTEGFRTGREIILSGSAGSPASRAIAAGGVRAAERLMPSSGAVRRAVLHRARMGGESFAPEMARALTQFGTSSGLGGVSDISGIELRGAQTRGDIARQAGAGVASALIGQAPNIARQIETGQEARALGQAQQAGAMREGAEQIAALLGRTT
jgi:hypothetical protein